MIVVIVDRSICSSYGVCVESAPLAFSFDEETKVVIAPDIPEDYLGKVRFACESCPTGALRIEESNHERSTR